MKSLFYLFLLANLTFFLWEEFVRLEPVGAESLSRTERPVDSIVLLKELPPPPAIAAADTSPAEPEAAADAGTTPAEETLSPPAEMQTAAQMPPPVPEAPPATAETPPTQDIPPADPVEPRVEAREFCARLGPFDAEAEAREAGRGIDGVRNSRVEARIRPAESGYWVLHPPAASLDEAKVVKRKLMEQGAKEALILRDGENANAVSLGFFRNGTRAENLLREYRSKGFEGLEIRARRDGKTGYWLHVRAQADSAAWKASLERVGAQRPGLAVEEKTKCGGNAAGGD